MAGEYEVERLVAHLDATGLSAFTANMAAADRATGGARDQIDKLAAVSKIAAEALEKIRITASQAAESQASASMIVAGVRGISDEAREAARKLDDVKLGTAQAAETRAVADAQVESLKKVERQAIQTRAAVHGSSGPGLAGIGRGVLLPAAIGGAALLAPAMGPSLLGLGGAALAGSATAIGGLGTGYLALSGGVTKAIGGDYKAFQQLNEQQKQFVQTVRSLNLGLHDIASNALLPGLTKALHEMFTPTLVRSMTLAVDDFGRAMGDAAQIIGKWFGSSGFADLVNSIAPQAASGFRDLAHIFVNVADALGHVTQAALPLMNWLGDATVKASAAFDQFVKGKQASGQLAGAMDMARQSMQQVGDLIGALVRVIGALGSALYPVSRTALADLIQGLGAVAKLVQQNQGVIRDLISGALSALVGAIKVTYEAFGMLFRALDAIFGSEHEAALITAITAVGVAIALAMGPESAAIVGAIAAIGLLKQHWGEFVDWFTVEMAKMVKNSAIIQVFSHLPGSAGHWARLAEGAASATLQKSAATAAGTYVPSTQMPESVRVAHYRAMAEQAARAQNVPQALFAAQINQESGFSPTVTSGAGAMGIAQFMPGTMGAGTAAQVAAGKAAFNAYNPSQALPKAAQLMARLHAKYGTWALALAAYNAGEGTVDRYLAGRGSLPYETQAYVQSIMSAAGKNWQPNLKAPATGGGAGTNPFGALPPWNTGTGSLKPPVIPASVQNLLNRARENAAKASAAGGAGGTAARYLQDQLDELEAAKKKLAALAPSSAKDKQTIQNKIASITAEITRVNAELKKAVLVMGDNLLPQSLRSKLAGLQAQYQADSAYAASLTGQAADDYRKVLKADLTAQAGVLEHEVQILKGKLAASSGKQRAAVQTELTKVQGQLDQVNQEILANLQQAVSALQSQVSSIFQSVQSEMDRALGNLYYQNGLLTPSEALLQSMQQADQLRSLQQALDQAKQTLSQDQSTLAKHVIDVATGRQWDVFDPANAQRIAQDQQAVQQAQRALDEYNLQIKATQERTAADQAYQRQVQSLNSDLAKWENQILNGTGSMQGLRDIAAKYGIQINTETIPDFKNLSTAAGQLANAFVDLIAMIGKITGKTPAPIPGSSGGGSGGGGGVGGLNLQQTIASQTPMFNLSSGGYVAGGVIRAGLPGYADGGPVPHDQVALVHGGEFVVPKGGALVMGGGGGGQPVEIHTHIILNGREIAHEVRKELIRTGRRNGNKTSALLGTN